MAKGGPKGAFTRDLTETALGGLILRYLVPLFSVGYGVLAISRGRIPMRSVEVYGTAAYLYGTAFVVLGLTIIGYPTVADVQEGRVSRFNTVRMRAGLILLGLLMIGAIVSLL
ncbi:MAG TPA: hypothetical protein VGE67_19425 [Haloferula sp.]